MEGIDWALVLTSLLGGCALIAAVFVAQASWLFLVVGVALCALGLLHARMMWAFKR
jgi:hypothetical protein